MVTSVEGAKAMEESRPTQKSLQCYLFTSEAKKSYELFNGIIFGRRSDVDITLNEKQISGKHFTIFIEKNEYFVKDLGSANKTYLNGDDIKPNKGYKLSHGDIIQVGDFVFGFSTKNHLDFHVPYGAATEAERTMTNINVSDIDKLDKSNDEDPSDKSVEFVLEKVVPGKPQKSGQGHALHEMREVKKELSETKKCKEKLLEKIKKVDLIEEEYFKLKNQRQSIRERFKTRSANDKNSVNKQIESYQMKIIEIQQVVKSYQQEVAKIQLKIDEQKKLIENSQALIEDYNEDLEEIARFEKISEQMRLMKKEILELRNAKKGGELEKIDSQIKDKEKKLKELQADYAKSLEKSHSL